MDPREPRQNLDPRHQRLFGPTPIFLDPRYLADSPHLFVALQLPLYYLEQLHQLAIEN